MKKSDIYQLYEAYDDVGLRGAMVGASDANAERASEYETWEGSEDEVFYLSDIDPSSDRYQTLVDSITNGQKYETINLENGPALVPSM